MPAPLSIRERILVAVLARLADVAGDFPGLVVRRNPTTECERYPGLDLDDGDQRPGPEENSAFETKTMTFQVSGFVQARADADIGPAINALWAAAVASLFSDVTFGGLAIDIHEGEMSSAKNTGADDQCTGAFEALFELEFATRHGDPYTLAP